MPSSFYSLGLRLDALQIQVNNLEAWNKHHIEEQAKLMKRIEVLERYIESLSKSEKQRSEAETDRQMRKALWR